MEGFKNIKMDRQLFAVLQKKNPWFTTAFLEGIVPLDRSKFEKNAALSDLEMHQIIFGMIFGSFGLQKNLDLAEELCLDWLHDDKRVATDIEWFCRMQIQLGTVYAYKNEPIKAAYHLMHGLKYEGVSLNNAYCDFIRCILDELAPLPKRTAQYSGRGMSAADPMGFRGGTILVASAAIDIISGLVGKNGEAIIAKEGRSGMFGHLVRRGSTTCPGQPNCIDIYETWLIDRNYELKTLRLYFDGYMTRGFPRKVYLPHGFCVANFMRFDGIYELIES